MNEVVPHLQELDSTITSNFSTNMLSPTSSSTSSPATTLSRYENQKRRDWNTFGQYLRNHRPPLTLSRCSGAHVFEFTRYLDQFGQNLRNYRPTAHLHWLPHSSRRPPVVCDTVGSVATEGGSRYVTPIDLDVVTPSGLASATISDVVIDLAAINNNQRFANNDGSPYVAPIWQGLIDSFLRWLPLTFWRRTFGVDAVRQTLDDLNVSVDQPADQRSFMSYVYRLLGSPMKTESALNLMFIGLFAFVEIKSQGDTEFPFQTHPHITRVAINSMPIYGLLFLAEHVISAAGPGPDSVYASIARAGRRLCLCILVASLASLFYF